MLIDDIVGGIYNNTYDNGSVDGSQIVWGDSVYVGDNNFSIGDGNFSVGDINYTLTKIIHTHLNFKGLCYNRINEVIGILECMKLELYSQIARPYEDKKKELNGAISELDA